MSSKYDDIINLPHYVSKTRTPMTLEARAAQFAPFAALSGHEEMIDETARYTDRRIELSDDEKEILSRRISQILMLPPESRPLTTLTFFRPDKNKGGGYYLRHTARIHKFDPALHLLHLDDSTLIPLPLLVNID